MLIRAFSAPFIIATVALASSMHTFDLSHDCKKMHIFEVALARSDGRMDKCTHYVISRRHVYYMAFAKNT